MIRGIGTPRSQSRIPRPIVFSLRFSGVKHGLSDVEKSANGQKVPAPRSLVLKHLVSARFRLLPRRRAARLRLRRNRIHIQRVGAFSGRFLRGWGENVSWHYSRACRACRRRNRRGLCPLPRGGDSSDRAGLRAEPDAAAAQPHLPAHRERRGSRRHGPSAPSRSPRPGLPSTSIAGGLDHPRWLHVLPNGDVLVAESNKPPKPDEAASASAAGSWASSWGRAGAEVPSANRISLLRDADGDGVAETKTAFLDGPVFAVRHDAARRHALCRQCRCHRRLPVSGGRDRDHGACRKDRRSAGRAVNHHWTKDVIASRDGTKLYATVGSNSNVGENGMDEEVNRAAVLEIDLASAADAALRFRAAQPERPVVESRKRRAVGGRQRTRRDRQRPRARLHDLGEGRRLLRLALQLLRPASSTRASSRRRPDLVAKAIKPDYALGSAYRIARLDLQHGRPFRPGDTRTAPSSASTARGTASRAAATR